MKNKAEVSKKIVDKERLPDLENILENKEKTSDLAVESFSVMDTARDESIKENKEISVEYKDENIKEICAQAEEEIKAAGEQGENKLIKLFNNLIDKADYKWNEVKNKRSYKKLYEELHDMGQEIYGEKVDKYKKEKDSGNSKKIDNYYLNFEERLLKYTKTYENIDKKYIYVNDANSLDSKLERQFETLIWHKIDQGEIEEALSLWNDCPNKIANREAAPDLAKKLKKVILEGTGLLSESRKATELLKERLADYPEIILLVLGDGGYYGKNESRKNNDFLKPLEEVILDPAKHYSLHQIDLSEDIFRKDLTPEIKKVVFGEYLKNNNRLISENIAIFQDEIEKITESERKNFFNKNINYVNERLSYASYIKLSPDELTSITESFGSGQDNKSGRVNFVQTAGSYNNYLLLLTNAENLGIDETAQKEILEIFENSGRSKVVEYAQLLAYPEKYPGLGVELINKSFSNFLENNKDSETLSKIFYNNIKLSDSQKEKFIDSCFAEPYPSESINFLNYNSQYLNLKDKEQIEKIVIEKIAYQSYFGLNEFRVLREFSPENLVAAIDQVKTIDISTFFELFVNYPDEMPVLPDKYLGKLVNTIVEVGSFSEKLKAARGSGDISEERYNKIITETCATWSVSKIVNSRLIDDIPETKSEFFNKSIESGNIDDLAGILKLITDKSLFLAEEDELKFCNKFLEKVDLKNLNLLYSPYSRDLFKEYFNQGGSDNLVSLFLKFDNVPVLMDFLEKDISDKNLKLVVDKIINFGDSDSRLALLKAFPNYTRYINGNYSSSVEVEKIDELVEVMIDRGEPNELVVLLKYGYPSKTDRNLEKLSPEKTLIVKNKIFDSGDPEALDDLFSIHIRNRDRLNLNENEKNKLADILISKTNSKNSNLFHLLKVNKEFSLSEEKIEALLKNLSENSQDQFIAALEENIYTPYFKIAKEKTEKIVTDFIAKQGEYAPEFFTMYVGSLRNINQKSEELTNVLNNDQIDLIINKISKEKNATGKFLVEYLELNENREKIAKKNEINIFTLSEDRIEGLVSVYIKDKNFSDRSGAEEIHSAYPDIFEEKFIQEIILNNQVGILLQVIESGSPAIISIVEKNQELIIQKLKDEVSPMDSNKKDSSSLLLFYNALNKLGSFKAEYFKGINEFLTVNDKPRNRILDFSSIFSSIIKNKNIEVIDEVSGEKLSERFMEFNKKYSISGKGETILNLIAAKEYKKAIEKDDDVTIDLVLLNIEKALEEYDRVLSLHKPEDIPAGLQASIGMEYEVTQTIAGSYKEKTDNSYAEDARKLSSNAGVGRGNDAVHEFATKPTDNPYLMLLEMKLLQDLDFIDFNFKSEEEGGYQGAASSYHLTIGGEQGMKINQQTNFLQNILLVANLGGVYTGTEVKNVGMSRGNCSIRNRGTGTNTVQVFDNLTSAVELRALAVDKWEQFERASLINYNATIAIQAVDKYTKINSFEKLQTLPQGTLDNSDSFYEFLEENSLIKENIEDEKIKEIIYQWLKVQVKIIQAVEDHNENFIMNETVGYLDEREAWVDASDFTRGRDNLKGFKDVITAVSPEDTLATYFDENLKIDNISSLFEEISVDLANRLTRLNNLYIKGDQVNINNMYNTIKKNGVTDSNGSHDAEQSIFDLGGERREGRYYIQGSSDRLLINQAQDLLLNFVEEMQKTLKKPSSVNNSNEIMAA